MNDREIKKIQKENKRLKEENKELKEIIKKLESKINSIKKSSESFNEKEDIQISSNDSEKIIKKENNLNFNNSYDKNEEDMSIISFLVRSEKRVNILKSLNQGDKIPSAIGKEIGDSSHHVSKYLATLKERELVVCLNEEDKRFRFYRITEKGKNYLEIVENNKY